MTGFVALDPVVIRFRTAYLQRDKGPRDDVVREVRELALEFRLDCALNT